MSALRSILVPADGSPPSLAALAHAVALAEDSGGRIDVLHVAATEESSMTTTLAPDAQRELERALAAAVDQATTRLPGRVSLTSLAGDPVRMIVETAQNGQYDLIVIGTHGRIGRLHELLGSVTEGVVRNAPCPVLTVREPGTGYQSFAERRHHRPSLAEHHPR